MREKWGGAKIQNIERVQNLFRPKIWIPCYEPKKMAYFRYELTPHLIHSISGIKVCFYFYLCPFPKERFFRSLSVFLFVENATSEFPLSFPSGSCLPWLFLQRRLLPQQNLPGYILILLNSQNLPGMNAISCMKARCFHFLFLIPAAPPSFFCLTYLSP